MIRYICHKQSKRSYLNFDYAQYFFLDNFVLVVYESLNTIEGKGTNLGRTFLTLFAIYRYFIGTIGKLKVYQY